ncbi:unnamed protein product [Rangifer tarandus platyrhynchus]|uniref:Uncharacterized protein n=2 Tax=Rangifer tarandus platyrhynchus TaxID=3082113 RepID=A0ABN8YDA3_RANTA|nr:unnamed protein product [Rangifer tarandus platyrhynchus]CAI9699874.1 unnamed protein product [Rangifer tarandus platyrhynchus]
MSYSFLLVPRVRISTLIHLSTCSDGPLQLAGAECSDIRFQSDLLPGVKVLPEQDSDTQTHCPQQVAWKKGKSDQEPEPSSWTNLGIWVCRYGLQVVESPDHGYDRKNQTTAFNVSVPTLQGHLSHHINLARLRGTAVEKLKRNRGHGYRRFLKGVLKSCVGGGHRGHSRSPERQDEREEASRYRPERQLLPRRQTVSKRSQVTPSPSSRLLLAVSTLLTQLKPAAKSETERAEQHTDFPPHPSQRTLTVPPPRRHPHRGPSPPQARFERKLPSLSEDKSETASGEQTSAEAAAATPLLMLATASVRPVQGGRAASSAAEPG